MLIVLPHFWETGHGEEKVSEPQLQVCGWMRSLLSTPSAGCPLPSGELLGCGDIKSYTWNKLQNLGHKTLTCFFHLSSSSAGKSVWLPWQNKSFLVKAACAVPTGGRVCPRKQNPFSLRCCQLWNKQAIIFILYLLQHQFQVKVTHKLVAESISSIFTWVGFDETGAVTLILYWFLICNLM